LVGTTSLRVPRPARHQHPGQEELWRGRRGSLACAISAPPSTP